MNTALRYRVNKAGVVRIHEGCYTMTPTDRVAIACGLGTRAITTSAGQEAFAAAKGAIAIAETPDTKAYATTAGAKARAIGKGTLALALHPEAKAYSRNKGSVAIATVAGARAYVEDTMGTAVEDMVQAVFPNKKAELRMTIR